MNPFIQMLIQSLMGGVGTNSFWDTLIGQQMGGFPGQQGSYFDNSFARANNPFFDTNPFPYFGQLPGQDFRTIGIGRNLNRPTRPGVSQQTPPRPLYGGQDVNLQPIPSEPVPIPAPALPVPPRNPFGGQLQLNPVPSQPMDIPAPFPNIPPREFAAFPSQQFFIEPMPGIRIPINMTGIPGGQSQGLPGRLPQDINYLPVPPRGLGGMIR